MARQAEAALALSEKRDHILGPAEAAVTLVEYGDFECPHCGAAHGILTELLQERGEQVRLVYRHFPLMQIHPRAEPAAEAAEAAGAQGRFWEMHDVLYENQDALEDDDLMGYAQELGLDVRRFAEDLAQGTYRDRVEDGIRSGVESGVHGTPTFFINGRRHEGAWDLESLRTAIDAAGAAPHAARWRRG